MLELDAQQAVERLLPDLRRPFPGLESHLRGVRVFRWPHGWTVFRPGYLAHLGRAPAGAEPDGAPVVLAGDYLCAPNVEGAVISGLRAAERLRGLRR
jgi:oxygen-dependent protoporphyrinogen oxidase